jgi:hypothetical protein
LNATIAIPLPIGTECLSTKRYKVSRFSRYQLHIAPWKQPASSREMIAAFNFISESNVKFLGVWPKPI